MSEPLTDEELDNWDKRYTHTADVELNFRAAAEIRKLREHAAHLITCDAVLTIEELGAEPCNCGLDDLLAEACSPKPEAPSDDARMLGAKR